METYTRKERIQSLKAELDQRNATCTALKRDFEKRPLSYEQQTSLFLRWEDTLKESQLIQSVLEMLESDEKHRIDASKPPPQFRTASEVTYLTWFYHTKK